MSRRTDSLAVSALLVLLCLAAGCQAPAGPPPDAASANVALDPCASRLHDICGRLLIYYAVHKELPERLADLDKTGTGPAGTGPAGTGPSAALMCPTSGKPYVYNRAGLQLPGSPWKLIMYDAEPCHSWKRWGILAEALRPGEPLVVRVVRPPEAAFSAPARRPDSQLR